jgi:hypothetical protein
VSSLSKSMYMDLTVKMPEVRFHLNVSSLSVSWTRINICNRWVNLSYLWLFRVLLKPISRGVEDNTFSTVTFLWFTILYKEGYSLANDLCPSHMSFQNRVLWPLPITNDPHKKTIFNIYKALLKRRVRWFSRNLRESFSA